MTENSQEMKEFLLQRDNEYRELVQKHHELESRLSEISAKHYLTEHEQLEEVTLKKRKLQLKDRMAEIMRRHLSTPISTVSPTAPPPPR